MNDKINSRQRKILTFLSQKYFVSRTEIKRNIETDVADITLIRDLNILEKMRFVESKGKTKGKIYCINRNQIQWPVDVDLYFEKDADDRQISQKLFNHNIFSKLSKILSTKEKNEMEELSQKFSTRKKTDEQNAGFKKELERVSIELSWKSSKIEGNTYTLLETEELLVHSKEAKGHTKQEAIMIINHKEAFSFIINNQEKFIKPDMNILISLHEILTKGLNVTKGFRKSLVGITGTVYRPLDNEWQIKEAVENMIETLENTNHPGEKALIANSIIAYIQPFVDGNKRTSRMFSNAILMAHNMPPLSYRSVDEQEYKKAILLFYETNNMSYIKHIFLEQFKFAATNYF